MPWLVLFDVDVAFYLWRERSLRCEGFESGGPVSCCRDGVIPRGERSLRGGDRQISASQGIKKTMLRYILDSGDRPP